MTPGTRETPKNVTSILKASCGTTRIHQGWGQTTEKDSRLGTDCGHSPHQSHHWTSDVCPLCPSSVPGGVEC